MKRAYIYRGSRIINWCPHCRTALSDAEVEYEEQAGQLVASSAIPSRIGQRVSGGGHHPAGDHAGRYRLWRCIPDDERYKDLVGKTLHSAH